MANGDMILYGLALASQDRIGMVLFLWQHFSQRAMLESLVSNTSMPTPALKLPTPPPTTAYLPGDTIGRPHSDVLLDQRTHPLSQTRQDVLNVEMHT